MDIQKFYHDIFPAPTNNYQKLIWTLKNRKSYWFTDVNQMIKMIQSSSEDIYYGLGIAEKKPSGKRASKQRALAEQIAGIFGVHLDIDIAAKDVHKKERLPTTMKEAMKIAYSVIEPTWIINSGHGIHVFYLFYKYQFIDNFEEWTNFIWEFQETVRQANPDYQIDSTHNLDRVLRCPGSMNFKDPENPVECKIIEYNDTNYYTIEEIQDVISYDKKESSGNKISTVHTSKHYAELAKQYTFDSNASIDSDRFIEVASIHNPKFMNEYNHNTGRDSNSEYDLSLAIMGLNSGLTDQEVIDLMIMHRRKHNVKMRRNEYYLRTLEKAQISSSKFATTTGSKKNDELSPGEIESIREYIFDKIGVHIEKIHRYIKDPNPVFFLELTNLKKEISLGTFGDGIWNQKAFLSKVAAHGITTIKPIKGPEWLSNILPKLQKLTVEGNSPDTATYEGQVAHWVRDYFGSRGVTDSIEDFFENNDDRPFYHNGFIYFNFEKLTKWIKEQKNQMVGIEFAISMQNFGFVQETVKHGNESARLWKVGDQFYQK